MVITSAKLKKGHIRYVSIDLLLNESREKSNFLSSTYALFSLIRLKFRGSNIWFLYICTDFVPG